MEEMEGVRNNKQVKMAKDKTNFLLTPEQVLELITRKALDAFIVSDTDNTVIVWSAYAETLFGWSAEEAIGRQLTSLIIPPEHHAAHEEGIKRYSQTRHSGRICSRTDITPRPCSILPFTPADSGRYRRKFRTHNRQ